jgi:phosphatidylserine decarboxylase
MLKKILFTLLPKNAVSLAFGKISSARIPVVSELIRDVFASAYQLNMSEAELPQKAYPNLQEMFTRRLRPGARPLADRDLICPVDGRLSQLGDLDHGLLIQAKGRDYTAARLLGDAAWAASYTGGAWATVYLAPFNYHRIHTAVAGRVTRVMHVPGQLWPVNQWSVSNIDQLFCVNERISVEMETASGAKVTIVMVGATNVGSIRLAFPVAGREWRSNDSSVKRARRWLPSDERAPKLAKGDELGVFALGSTIVMLLDAKARAEFPELLTSPLDQNVVMGQAFGAPQA